MSQMTGNVRLQLRRILSRFEFEEWEVAVLPSFPELTWNKLRSYLIEQHQNFTVSASIRVIEKIIQDAEIEDKDLRNRLSTLELMDVSRHSTRKLWTCHELRGAKTSDNFQSDQDIQEKLSQSFLMNVQRMDIRVTSHNNITFVLVKARKSARQQNEKLYPTFFAFLNGHNYFFASMKTVAKNYLTAITQGLGYTSSKLAKLSGRDLKSLIQLLWAKQQATINNENILKSPICTDFKPVVRSTGIDFTQSKPRGEYVDQCFGTKPPNCESLEVTYTNQTWKCNELVPDLENEVFDIKWEFYSRRIPTMIKELAERRVIRVPLPAYAKDMLTIGRNEMTLRLSGETK